MMILHLYDMYWVIHITWCSNGKIYLPMYLLTHHHPYHVFLYMHPSHPPPPLPRVPIYKPSHPPPPLPRISLHQLRISTPNIVTVCSVSGCVYSLYTINNVNNTVHYTLYSVHCTSILLYERLWQIDKYLRLDESKAFCL